ncbi:MAG TPA: hypothetical protein DD381_01820 [Lentisphaeria bacterium]|nr:MAG: hypothetical protein A2X47_10210 [Lentisphaerae bacterium GWF2_38_69]HBM15080.1 hypothetical protein [Lentisphaeria bacterium]
MKNLEQIRAKNALEAAPNIKGGEKDGEVVKKIPPMIRDSGILAAAAFAKEKGKGYQSVIDAIVCHLKCDGIGIMPRNETDFIKWLAEKVDSAKLRAVTEETMAYLNYLRRFVR